MSKSKISKAFDQGVADLRGTAKVGGPGKTFSFLLPLVVEIERGKRQMGAGPMAFTTFKDLTDPERTALATIWKKWNTLLSRVDLFAKDHTPSSGSGSELRKATALTELEAVPLPRSVLAEMRKTRLEGPYARLSGFAGLVRREYSFELFELRRTQQPGVIWNEGEDDAELLTFLQNTRSPDLWHQIVGGFNYDLDITYQALDWISQQPELDRGTACLMFRMLCGEEYVNKPITYFEGRWNGRDAMLIGRLSERELGEGFQTAEFDAPPYDGERWTKWLDGQRARAGEAGTVPLVEGFFAGNTGSREANSGFTVDEDCRITRR